MNAISEQKQRFLQRAFFSAWLAAWLYRLDAHVLLHQMQSPPLFNAHVDLTYWLAHLLQVPEFVTGHFWAAALIDGLLVVVPVLGIVFPKNKVFPPLFLLFFIPYYFAFNTFGLKHTHCLVGFLLVPLAFFPRGGRGQYLVWEGLRFFTCWVFVAATGWKLARGFFLEKDHGLAILQSTRAMYLADHAGTPLGQSLLWLMRHPDLLHALMAVGGAVQAVFLVGFFTKRFDLGLVLLSFVFHLANYFLFDIVFFEILVLNLSFWAVAAGRAE